MNTGAENPNEPTQSRTNKQVLDEINKALIGLRFGQVTVMSFRSNESTAGGLPLTKQHTDTMSLANKDSLFAGAIIRIARNVESTSQPGSL